MSLRHMVPETRAEVRVGARRVAIEEKEGVAYILVDDDPIDMRYRLRETVNSFVEAGTDPPFIPAHTFPLESAPDSTPEVRTYAMGNVFIQWKLPQGFLRVELSADMTSANVDVWQQHSALS
jgi:hypothetical protein